MNDADGFRLEAAEQFGFVDADLGEPGYFCTEAELIAFAKACERKGMYEACHMPNQKFVLDKIADIDAELAPLRVKAQQALCALRDAQKVKPEPPRKSVSTLHTCPCGLGEEPCPGANGKPLCAEPGQ